MSRDITGPGPNYVLPPGEREAELKHIFRQIDAGESSSLVGVGSVGKSNLVYQVTRPEIRQRYISNSEYTVCVMLDPHLLVWLEGQAKEIAGDCWSGYELMLKRLYDELAQIRLMMPNLLQMDPRAENTDRDVVEAVKRYYANLMSTNALNVQAGIRHLENAVYQVLRLDPRWKLVFILDEFETFLSTLPPHFFQSLRGLRDKHKGRVMYITTSRARLMQLITTRYPSNTREYRIMEGFAELCHGFVHHIPPLDKKAALLTIDRYKKRHQKSDIPDKVIDDLLRYTGRHAGLLRRGFQALVRVGKFPAGMEIVELLVEDQGIVDECNTIFESLFPEEQQCLISIVKSGPTTCNQAALISLKEKLLVEERSDGSYGIKYPLFGAWVSKQVL